MNVELAYNSTNSIPSSGDSKRKTYNVRIADDSECIVQSERTQLADKSTKRDVVGTTLKLKVYFGAGIMTIATDRAWLTSFFQAKHRWVVYGNFKDTTNSSNNNLCKCEPPEDEVVINVAYDRENGYTFLSEKVF